MMRTTRVHRRRILVVALVLVPLTGLGLGTVARQQTPRAEAVVVRPPSAAVQRFPAGTRPTVLRFQASRGLETSPVRVRPRTAVAVSSRTPPAPYNKYRGPNYTNRVLLSFDDCPKSPARLRAVLTWLTKNNVGVMMFPTGNCIRSFASRYRVNITLLMRAHGQYVGNHSISHSHLTHLSRKGMLRQLGAPGVVTNYGRPPYGAVNPTVDSAYAAKGMREVLWTVDSRDWTGKSAGRVGRDVIAKSKPRSMVLMHMQWRGFYPATLAQIKTGLTRKGLTLCRKYPGTAPVRTPDRLPC